VHHRDLHSFPTRRSSDLEGAARLGVSLTFVIARGDPYTELRRVADEMRADAVVVGASTQAGHRWIGSLAVRLVKAGRWPVTVVRSEEHTSELQSRENLVC